MRLSALIQLASAVYAKNPQENKSQAVAVLNQARLLVADEPEKSSDLNALANLAAGYAQIEPVEAFRLLESLVSPFKRTFGSVGGNS
jgi:ABC-type antimicrobial peptide transport system ATPase subunit